LKEVADLVYLMVEVANFNQRDFRQKTVKKTG